MFISSLDHMSEGDACHCLLHQVNSILQLECLQPKVRGWAKFLTKWVECQQYVIHFIDSFSIVKSNFKFHMYRNSGSVSMTMECHQNQNF